MKKRSFIGCGVIAVLALGLCTAAGVLFVGKILVLTQPVVDASEQFLTLLGQGKTAEAYASAADGFRARQDVASFTAAVKQLGLTNYASVSWRSRQIENSEGSAEGIVATTDGAARPVALRLVREGDRWAVVGVRYGGVDLTTVKVERRPPPAEEVERLVTDSLLALNQAVRSRDFMTFYGTLAESWKPELTPQRLEAAFQEFLDQKVDIGPIKDVKPQVAPPAALNDEGELVVAGRYPIRPTPVKFKLRYAYENAGWKLVAISVSMETGDAAE